MNTTLMARSTVAPLLAAALLALTAGTALAADVVVVDPGGSNGKQVLQSAINAASDGDVLILLPGGYDFPAGALEIDGKGLVVLAERDTTPPLLDAVHIRNVPEGSTVLLRGLEIREAVPGTSVEARLRIENCQGAIWIEDCAVAGSRGDGDAFTGLIWPGREAAAISDSASVALLRCTIRGGDGHDHEASEGEPILWATGGGNAVTALRSRVVLHDSVLQGGHGGDGAAFFLWPGGGARGLDAEQCQLIVSGGALIGGDEGEDNDIGILGTSGHGLYMILPLTPPWLRDTALAAGATSGLGYSGVPVFPPAGSAVYLPAAARSLRVETPVREGESFVVTAGGLQNDLVSLYVSLQGDWLPVLAGQGALLTSTSNILGPVALHTIRSPSGTMNLDFVAPHLPPALGDGTTVLLQGLFAGNDGLTLGGATSLVWIDGSL
jgi:hypothetical protein